VPVTPTRSASTSPRTVYDEIRRQIVDGELPPGTQLVEGTIAKTFGVSRTPVREALTQLAYDGLIERHDRVLRVRVLRPEDVLELYEVRIALERAAARAAAERRTELDTRGLQRVVEQMRALADGVVEDRPRLAHQFHFTLWKASHNPAMIEALESVHLRVVSLSSTTLHYPERWEVFREECGAIAQAIADRDVDQAGIVAEQQMTNARDFRLQLYSSDNRF